jgi:hypothetical protein
MLNMRKTAAALISAFLIAAAVGTRSVSLGTANSLEDDFPGTTPPQLLIESPNSEAIYINGVPLNFTLKRGDMSFYGYDFAYGACFCSLDNQPNVTVNRNVILTGLSRGIHRIDIYCPYYVVWGQMAGPYFAPSKSVIFQVAPSTPAISILTPENRTYNATALELAFSVHEEPEGLSQQQRNLVYNANETYSWLAYSLDGQANITITGNMTLSHLSEGEHSITVYANNTNGIVGASETIIFIVEVPEPFPIVTVAAVSVTVIAVVTAILLVYFKKRKH